MPWSDRSPGTYLAAVVGEAGRTFAHRDGAAALLGLVPGDVRLGGPVRQVSTRQVPTRAAPRRPRAAGTPHVPALDTEGGAPATTVSPPPRPRGHWSRAVEAPVATEAAHPARAETRGPAADQPAVRSGRTDSGSATTRRPASLPHPEGTDVDAAGGAGTADARRVPRRMPVPDAKHAQRTQPAAEPRPAQASADRLRTLSEPQPGTAPATASATASATVAADVPAEVPGGVRADVPASASRRATTHPPRPTTAAGSIAALAANPAAPATAPAYPDVPGRHEPPARDEAVAGDPDPPYPAAPAAPARSGPRSWPSLSAESTSLAHVDPRPGSAPPPLPVSVLDELRTAAIVAARRASRPPDPDSAQPHPPNPGSPNPGSPSPGSTSPGSPRETRRARTATPPPPGRTVRSVRSPVGAGVATFLARMGAPRPGLRGLR